MSEKSRGLDVSDWILSGEISDYIRENHLLSATEKAEIIDGGCRSIEEKYEALKLVAEEAETEKEGEVIRSLLRMYEWALEEIRRERPGQVFVFQERIAGGKYLLSHRYRDVWVVHTWEEVTGCLREYESYYEGKEPGKSWPERVDCAACIVKWAPVDGRMEKVLGLDVYVVDGHIFLQGFTPWYLERKGEPYAETVDVFWEADRIHDGTRNNELPLPFRTGDLVRVDFPDLEEPVYGVLNIAQCDIRYMDMAYIWDGRLRSITMTYQLFNLVSDWRVIDWTHPAEASELPPGQELLAELSSRMHLLNEESPQAAEELFSELFGERQQSPAVVRQTALTLSELLEQVGKGEEPCLPRL